MDEELQQFIKSYIMSTSGKHDNDATDDQSQKMLPAAAVDETPTPNDENVEHSAVFVSTEFDTLSNLDEFGIPIDSNWKITDQDLADQFGLNQDVTNVLTQTNNTLWEAMMEEVNQVVLTQTVETDSEKGNGLRDAWSDEEMCNKRKLLQGIKKEVAGEKVKKPRILSARTLGMKPMAEMSYNEAMLIWESLTSQGLDKFKRYKNEGNVETREEAEDQKMDDHQIFRQDVLKEKVKTNSTMNDHLLASLPVVVPMKTELQSPL